MAEYASENGGEDRYLAEKESLRYSDEENRRSSSRSRKHLGSGGHHSTSLSKSRSRSRSRSREHRHRHSRSRSRTRSRSRSQSGEREGVRVHVGEIDGSITDRDLEDAFGKFGKILEIWVATYAPYFAFIVFGNRDDAEEAVRYVNGSYIRNCKVRVSLALPRRRYGGRGPDRRPPPRYYGGPRRPYDYGGYYGGYDRRDYDRGYGRSRSRRRRSPSYDRYSRSP